MGQVVRWISDTESGVCDGNAVEKMSLEGEDGDDKRDKKRVRNVMAGRMLGGCWARKGRVPRIAYGAGSSRPFPDLSVRHVRDHKR